MRIPPAFVLAFVVQSVMVAVRLWIVAANKSSVMGSPYWGLVAQGIGFVTLALLAAGAFDLSRRTVRPASHAARVAGVIFATGIGITIASTLVEYLQMTRAEGALSYEIRYAIEGYLWSAMMIGGILALVIAGGWRRAPALAVVAVVGIVIYRAPPILSHELYAVLGRKAGSFVTSFAWLSALGATFALIAQTQHAEPAEDSATCERGLRRAAASLWIRVIAAALLAGLAMFAVVARRGGGAASMVKFAMIAGPVLNAFALGSFGIGAFTAARSGVRDLSSYTLYVAGALSIWASGAMLGQLPWVYELFYRDDAGSHYGGEFARDMVGSLTLGIPLVAAAGIVALTIAIAGFARRRDLQELRDQTSTRAGAFVVLIIVSLLIQQYGIPKAQSEGTFLAMSLAAAGAGLCAIVMLAKLCSLAADAVRQAPGLPTATLRPPD